MEGYLSNWEERVTKLGEQIGFPKRLAILGRGSSMASTYTGALTLGEASKFLAAPYQAGEFRHGPLELANPDLTVLLFAGPAETRELNLHLLHDLRGYSVNAFWIGAESEPMANRITGSPRHWIAIDGNSAHAITEHSLCQTDRGRARSFFQDREDHLI